MKKASAIVTACLVLMVGGCGSDEASDTSSGGQETSEGISGTPRDRFATIYRQEGSPKPRIDPSDLPPPKKILIRDIRVGNGPVAREGDLVTIYYLGVGYKTGKEMFWRWRPEQPFEFELGLSSSAFDRVIEGMRVGGRREYVIPSHLAFRTGAIDYIVDLLAVKAAPNDAARKDLREG